MRTVFDPDTLKRLTSWTPIARRSRTPLKRHRISKDGESREVLYAHPWEPVVDAPMTVNAALDLVKTVCCSSACEYETDDEVVVVRRVAASDR